MSHIIQFIFSIYSLAAPQAAVHLVNAGDALERRPLEQAADAAGVHRADLASTSACEGGQA